MHRMGSLVRQRDAGNDGRGRPFLVDPSFTILQINCLLEESCAVILYLSCIHHYRKYHLGSVLNLACLHILGILFSIETSLFTAVDTEYLDSHPSCNRTADNAILSSSDSTEKGRLRARTH